MCADIRGSKAYMQETSRGACHLNTSLNDADGGSKKMTSARLGSKDAKCAINWAKTLSTALGIPVTVVREKQIGPLWAGYGYVSSIKLSLPARNHRTEAKTPAGITPHVSSLLDVAYASTPPTLDIMVKQVEPPVGSGVSHDRKIRSYEAEAEFYGAHAGTLLNPSVGTAWATDDPRNSHAGLNIPVPLHVASDSPHTFTFVLSDLRQEFPVSVGDMDMGQLMVALTWLAQLHAHFWETPSEQLNGLWLPQGSYWHLDTRKEELDRIGEEWHDLKAAAEKVDLLLKGLQPNGEFSHQHMTVCHGDFKGPNLLFSQDGSRCAAYDFQYVGRSYGARDIAYLIARSGDIGVLDVPGNEDKLLHHYHTQLKHFLSQKQPTNTSASKGSQQSGQPSINSSTAGSSIGEDYTIEVLQRHYELALLDFVRFRVGWGQCRAPAWSAQRARQLLAKGIV